MADRIENFEQFEPWRTAREWVRFIYGTLRIKLENLYLKLFEGARFVAGLCALPAQPTQNLDFHLPTASS